MKLSTTIVIPTYNGLKLLKRHLPSVIKHSHTTPILIIDDASTDSTVSWVNSHYPQIQLIRNSKNLGFARSVNKAITTIHTDLFLLLNNDVSLHPHTLPQLQSHFSNPNLFAVGAQEKLPSTQTRGQSTGYFHRGLLHHQAATSQTAGPTLWVFGASGMFRRHIWLQLRGFDPLFRPAYWEDIDISYRAWKAGFTCLFDPQAIVSHQTEQSMTKALGSFKFTYSYKNQLLFFWKNVTDFPLFLSHLLWLPYHLSVTSLRTRGQFLHGFFLALLQLPELCRQSLPQPRRTDRQVINQVSPS